MLSSLLSLDSLLFLAPFVLVLALIIALIDLSTTCGRKQKIIGLVDRLIFSSREAGSQLAFRLGCQERKNLLSGQVMTHSLTYSGTLWGDFSLVYESSHYGPHQLLGLLLLRPKPTTLVGSLNEKRIPDSA